MKLPASLLRPLWAVVALAAMTACRGAIYDGEGDCTAYYRIRFRYDWNMKFADAFAHEVKAVTLYVFDRSGNLVLQQSASGAELGEEGYLMPVELAPGDYDLLAWCGEGLTDGGRSFSVPAAETKEALRCTMTRTRDAAGRAAVDPEGGLKPLYHGYAPAQHFPEEEGVHVIDLPLKKNTNRIRVLLNQQGGEPIAEEDFLFEITDDNGRMEWDNSLLPDDRLVYPAWHVETGFAELGPEEDIYDEVPAASEASALPAAAATAASSAASTAAAASAGLRAAGGPTSVGVALAEFTIGRLVKEGHNPTLTVKVRETGKTVFSLPLIKYVLFIKGYYDREIDDQEYLDRQDDFALTFFLDSGGRWIDTYIYINDWRVVPQDVDL